MSNDFFKEKAAGYDQVTHRVANVENIAKTIGQCIDLASSMKIMDFGSGTGLLLERIAPSVDTISAVDISTSMNKQLEMKRGVLECQLEILEMDLTASVLDRKFDGIISSMTLHHVENIHSIFSKFYAMLEDSGFIAIADLDSENGSFHQEDTGVFHFGFSREELLSIAESVGFRNTNIVTASTVCKPQGNYSVFLLTATK